VYIVLVGVAAILYALLLPARRKEGKAEQQSLKETEAALELYMADIERENEELVQLVSSIKQQSQTNDQAMQGQIGDLQRQLTELQQNSSLLEGRVTNEEKRLRELEASVEKGSYLKVSAIGETSAGAEMSSLQPEVKAKPISSIKLRYPRLFEMHEQGKSIDSIAKTAGLQRGEVQLILQLAKQEESV
jgi:predicted nuclease with TOPRIM domain